MNLLSILKTTMIKLALFLLALLFTYSCASKKETTATEDKVTQVKLDGLKCAIQKFEPGQAANQPYYKLSFEMPNTLSEIHLDSVMYNHKMYTLKSFKNQFHTKVPAQIENAKATIYFKKNGIKSKDIITQIDNKEPMYMP